MEQEIQIAVENKTKPKRVPKLRFKEFDGNWNETTLGHLFTFKNGLNSDKEKYGSGIKFINVLDIIANKVITNDSIIGKVEVTDKELEKNKVIYGDVLFQRSSETREEVGQSNIYVDKTEAAVFGGFVIRGRKKQNYDPYFINYLLKTSPARKEITTKSGGSTRYNVGQESLSQVNVKLTKLPEQKKIATFLSAVDKKIQQLNRKKELLETYKKGVMQQLFSQKLRFKDENGKDFQEWEEKRLGDITSLLKDGTHGTHQDSPGSDYYLLSAKNINNGNINKDETDRRISESEYKGIYKNYCLKENDILLTVVGTIGRVAKFGKESKIAFQRSVAFFRFDKNSPGYLLQFMQGIQFQKELDKRKVISAQPGVYLGDLAKIIFQLPDIEEQQKIADFLSGIDIKIEAVSQQITHTQSFKKGLLQQMFV